MPAFDFDPSSGHGAADIPAKPEWSIGGLYTVHADQPLGPIGGLPAFAATDISRRRTGLIAIPCLAHLPPRSLALTMLENTPVEGMMCPIAHGPALGPDGLPAMFIIHQSPGDTAAGTAPWRDTDLIATLLRPAAAALDRLQSLGLTHRAIRADNLFRGRHGDAVVLGPAWSAPPGYFQPALYEPPCMAMCHPAGRGDGHIADDVYALGITLVVLALGHDPLAGMSDDAIIRRKLEIGSFAAVTGDARLPTAIADLARGMLAEDPDHRPTPAMLANPSAARSRRVAARPPRRAQRSLQLGGHPVWTARNLAHALCTAPDQGIRLLHDGSIDRWLRRSLGDPALAVRLEECMRRRGTTPGHDPRAEKLLLLRAVTLLDPLAPLSWGGLALWPDGIGTLLAATVADPPAQQAALREIVESEAQFAWASMQEARVDAMRARLESHRQLMWLRQRGWGGGLPRLRYALNPLLPCASPTLAGHLVTRIDDLLPALDKMAAGANASLSGPIDAQIGAFMTARHEHRIDADLLTLADAKDPARSALIQLRLLARLQRHLHQDPMPALASWLAARATPLLLTRQNRTKRGAALAELQTLALKGDLLAIQNLIDDPSGQATDTDGAALAKLRALEIDGELADLSTQGDARAQIARTWAQELAMSAGYVLLAALVAAAVLA
jgi:hypothetical protein